MKCKAITPAELEHEYKRCLVRERDRYREWAKTRQGAFETYQVMHLDAEAEEATERENSTSWLSDRGRGAAAIHRCGKVARPQDDPNTRQRCIDRAKHLVMRRAPECLETFWLILKNGKKQERVDMAAYEKRNVEMTRNWAAAKVRYWDNLKKLQILFKAQ